MKPQGPDKIFASTSCLSKEQLLQYTKNELSPVDKHMAEMHMVDCELCSDAVEGVVLLSGMKIVNDTISEVKKLTPKKIKPLKSSSYKIWFAAASLIFIIGTTTYLYRQVHQVPKSLLSEEKSTYTEPQVRNLPAPPEKMKT